MLDEILKWFNFYLKYNKNMFNKSSFQFLNKNINILKEFQIILLDNKILSMHNGSKKIIS